MLPLKQMLYIPVWAFPFSEYLKAFAETRPHHPKWACKRLCWIPWISHHRPLRTQVKMWIKIGSCDGVLITLESGVSSAMRLACKSISLHNLPPSPLPIGILRIFFNLHTNVWNVTTKPSWMSKHRSDEERRGNGRKNCSFCFPWHAISILYPHLSKSYLKHINFIFLGWMGLWGSPPDMARWQWVWKERMKMIIPPSCL